jgi:hypothetical protein
MSCAQRYYDFVEHGRRSAGYRDADFCGFWCGLLRWWRVGYAVQVRPHVQCRCHGGHASNAGRRCCHLRSISGCTMPSSNFYDPFNVIACDAGLSCSTIVGWSNDRKTIVEAETWQPRGKGPFDVQRQSGLMDTPGRYAARKCILRYSCNRVLRVEWSRRCFGCR